ncbi:hypothetical protein [Spirosoma aerolatum]|uniref:hypothetical protein n=1 Tax=Spirosoma aerolatum TaxID=1211326 RepID=UPI0009AC62C2|nr:hypothetical protein [Spirosoma aerolatum]
MTSNNGLYINGQWVSEVDFTLTFQGNDLSKPDTRTASFSNTFTLPDSLAMRDIMQGGEQVDAGGPLPYRQLPASVIDEGEQIFKGFIEFDSFQAGWKANLFDSLLSFWDAIKDKALTALDLSGLDHPWTLEHISSVAGSSDGVVYPMIDYGGIDAGIVPYDTIYPGVFVKTIFGQICKEAGYKPVGGWLNDPLFLAMALPFVGADPKSHDQQWIDDRSAWITTNGGTASIVLENGSPVDMVLPFSVDNLILDGYKQGKLQPFKTDRYTYICPDRMRLKVQVQIQFISIVKYGAADINLILLRNGQEIATSYYTKGGYYDGLDIPETLTLNESVDCLKDDEIRIKLKGSSRTEISDYQYFFSLASGDMWVSFTPDASVHLGDMWPVAPNLPSDISCSDLVLTIAKAMQGTYVVDELKKTVRLVPLDDTVTKIPIARDWSTSVDESVEPQFDPKIEGYGAKNWCKWKENEDKANIGYGDGYLSSILPDVRTEPLFELPFMAAVQSQNVIGGYGAPILIKTRTIQKSGDTTSVEKNDAGARIVLIDPTKTVTVQTKTLTPAGDIVTVPVTLTGCWWAIRPEGVRTDQNSFSLAFSPVFGQTEQPLLDRYFKALKRVLRRPRMLTVSVYLEPSEVATLDLSVPIRLKGVRAGSLEINDNVFYLNKLGPYRSGKVCNAALIAL